MMIIESDLRLAGIYCNSSNEVFRVYKDSNGILYNGFSSKKADESFVDSWKQKLLIEDSDIKEYFIYEIKQLDKSFVWVCKMSIYDACHNDKASIFGYSNKSYQGALEDVNRFYKEILNENDDTRDLEGLNLKRRRWVIMRNNRTEIFCGLARNYEFRKLDEIKNAPIKTYLSEKKALTSFNNSWWKIDFEYEVVPVNEIFQQV